VLNDLGDRLKIRAVVVSSPIFDDVARWKIHGEMPVPREYFKIVAWRSEGRLAAAGWVQQRPDNVMSPIRASPETISIRHSAGPSRVFPQSAARPSPGWPRREVRIAGPGPSSGEAPACRNLMERHSNTCC